MTAAAETRSAELARSLRTNLPDVEILTDIDGRAARSRDWWPLARLREVRGDAATLPVFVVLPKSTEEVAGTLRWASVARVAVVPRGLGSGVCGGAMAREGAIVLDLSRMNRVRSIDRLSQVVEVEAGIRGDMLEAAVAAGGMTLGHYPQSIDISTVGGWIACWSSGQASPGYGSIEHRLLGLTVAMADGSIVRLPPQPRPAAGPDLRRLFVGAEGTLGIVTEAWLACAPADPEIAWLAYRYPAYVDTLTAAREILRAGIGGRVVRGWDDADSVRAFGKSQGFERGCVGLVGIPRSAPGLDGRRARANEIASSLAAEPLDPSYGETWWAHRLDAVGVFNDVMGEKRSLGSGVVLDTFEVTGLWRDLPGIYRATIDALKADCAEARCHFSHVYSAGAAFYFTFVVRAADDHAAEAAYLRAWSNALRACQAAHGSIAHHHGVGRVKGDAFAAEIGEAAFDLLGKLRRTFDSAAVLNPELLGGHPLTKDRAAQ